MKWKTEECNPTRSCWRPGVATPILDAQGHRCRPQTEGGIKPLIHGMPGGESWAP